MKTASAISFAAPFSLAVFIAGLGGLIWLYLNGAAIDPDAGREAMIAAIWNHVGWGAVTAPVLLVYIGWRLFAGSSASATIADKVSIAVLAALAAAVVFLVVTGPITVWTYGTGLKVFDWFSIPSPTGKAPALHSFVEQAHVFVAHCIPWLVGAEALLFAAVRVGKR